MRPSLTEQSWHEFSIQHFEAKRPLKVTVPMAYGTRFTPPKTALATVFEPKTKVSELQPLQIPRAAANGHSILLPSPPAQLLPSATELRIPPAEQWCLLGGCADFWMFFPSGILCKYTSIELLGNTQTEELRVQYYKAFFSWGKSKFSEAVCLLRKLWALGWPEPTSLCPQQGLKYLDSFHMLPGVVLETC